MGARRHAARRANDTAQDTATGAARPNQQRLAELDAPRVVHGSGGYTYQQHPDGALVILDGPRGKGTRIEPGGPKAAAWQAITREIGAYPRQARAPATPEGDLFQGLLQGVEHVGEVVADKVGGAVDQAGDAVNGMVHGVVDGVKHAAGDVIETVAGWWDKLTGGAKPAAPQTGGDKTGATDQQTGAGDQQTAGEQQPAGDVVTIQRGELTALGEGSDAQTRNVHWPHTEASGVTLGKGYDIGSRTAEQVIADLTAAGMSEEQAKKISEGAGLKGDAAGAWVNANRSAVGDISRDVQLRLLATMLDRYTTKAKNTATSTTADGDNRNAAGRERSEGKPAGTYVMTDAQWNNLHPAMSELLTDLIYQGGYYGYDRVAKINERLIANDGDQLAQLKAVRELFTGEYMDTYAGKIGEGKGGKGSKETFFGQEVDLEGEYRRNQIRLAYLNHVISSLESGKKVEISRGP